MIYMKQVLSIEQMKNLGDLGIDTSNASMTWMLYPYEEDKQPKLSLREWNTFKEPFRIQHCIPAFTLLDVLELLPKEIKTGTNNYWLVMSHDSEKWYVCYSEFDYYKEFRSHSLIPRICPTTIIESGQQKNGMENVLG